MGRHRTCLELTPAQLDKLRHLLQATPDVRAKERLNFVLRAAGGRDTLEDLARQAGRSRSTIQNWLVKLRAGGVVGLLDRDTPPGMTSPLAAEPIQAEFEEGMKSGRWQSAAEIASWLKLEHGIERSRKSIYYWIHKLRARTRTRATRVRRPAPRRRRVR